MQGIRMFRRMDLTIGALWALALLQSCIAINDGHYGEEDDATVIPIVIPIVVVVLLVCIVACCWQGKKCPCFKKADDQKKKKQENDESNVKDFTFVENEKKASTRNQTGSHRAVSPPPYSALAGQRNKDLPGRPATRQGSVITNGSSRHEKKAGYYPRSAGTTSGYDSEITPHARASDKYRVYDNRSQRNAGNQRDQQRHGRYYDSNRGGHGRRNEGGESAKVDYSYR